MTWRLAKGLDVLRAQINALSPNRSKAADGTIGDAAHSSRTSDHNPNHAGVVCALDITHDPVHGVDSEKLAEMLLASRDPRIKYIISNRKIASFDQGWAWRKYTGANPHNHHVHISVRSEAADGTEPWNLALSLPPAAAVAAPRRSDPLLVQGAKGEAVRTLQDMLDIKSDGVFGPATKAAVVAFQKAHGLVSDGVVGTYTWLKLREA